MCGGGCGAFLLSCVPLSVIRALSLSAAAVGGVIVALCVLWTVSVMGTLWAVGSLPWCGAIRDATPLTCACRGAINAPCWGVSFA